MSKYKYAILIITFIIIILVFGAWNFLENDNDLGAFDPDEIPAEAFDYEDEQEDNSIGFLIFDNLTEKEVLDAFINSDLPIGDHIIYDEDSCPDNLLGRPEQYVGKAVWQDTTLVENDEDHSGGMVEVFFSEDDLLVRKEIMDDLDDYYILVHKNVIVYLDSNLDEENVEGYEKVLRTLRQD